MYRRTFDWSYPIPSSSLPSFLFDKTVVVAVVVVVAVAVVLVVVIILSSLPSLPSIHFFFCTKEELLDNDADPHIADKSSKTPLEAQPTESGSERGKESSSPAEVNWGG